MNLAQTIVHVAKDHVSSEVLDGEVVILNLKDGMYYGLTPIGTRIWTLLQEPVTVLEIRDRLLEQYDVEPGQCERDLITLLKKLASRELIKMKENTN